MKLKQLAQMFADPENSPHQFVGDMQGAENLIREWALEIFQDYSDDEDLSVKEVRAMIEESAK